MIWCGCCNEKVDDWAAHEKTEKHQKRAKVGRFFVDGVVREVERTGTMFGRKDQNRGK